MSTALAHFVAQDGNSSAWFAARCGKFTASEISRLMSEPKSVTDEDIARYGHLLSDEETWKVLKTGPRAGEREYVTGYASKLIAAASEAGTPIFSSGALSYIDEIAWERVTGQGRPSGGGKPTDRGNDLEPVAFEILNRHWTPLTKGEFYPHPVMGSIAGASPDFLMARGQETGDLKCPHTFGHLVSFSFLRNDDHEAFKAWDVNYYWQVMMQQSCTGTTKGHLTLFDDRAEIVRLTEDERNEAQTILDFMAERRAETTGFGYRYEYASNGFAFVDRWWSITPEIEKRIRVYVAAADKEANARAEHFKRNLVL